MESESALGAVQRMHQEKTLTRAGLIGWYRWNQNQLPPLEPESSERDLLLALATWMDLTEKGGKPAFPYSYATDLDFSTVDLDTADRPSLAWLLGVLLIGIGLVVLFIKVRLGITLVAAGLLFQWLMYKACGGASAVAMKDSGVRRQVDRALEWVETHQR